MFIAKNSAIFTVGYMDPDSLGFIISKARKGDLLNLFDEKEIKVNCEIKSFRFPSHSNKDELLQIVKSLSPDKVILIHGEESSINSIALTILNQNENIQVLIAEKGKETKIQ